MAGNEFNLSTKYKKIDFNTFVSGLKKDDIDGLKNTNTERERKKLKNIFDKLDVSQNGELDAEEIYELKNILKSAVDNCPGFSSKL